MKRNLKQTLEIAETASYPKTKLQASAIANDCYKYIMDLITSGVMVTDAIKYVQGQMDHLIQLKRNYFKISNKRKEKVKKRISNNTKLAMGYSGKHRQGILKDHLEIIITADCFLFSDELFTFTLFRNYASASFTCLEIYHSFLVSITVVQQLLLSCNPLV